MKKVIAYKLLKISKYVPLLSFFFIFAGSKETIIPYIMKKILLSFTLVGFLALLGFAQNLSLSDDGGAVPNNSNRVFSGTPSTQTIYAHMNITNNSAGSIEVFVKKVIIDTVTGTVNMFCWAGGCYPPETFVSPNAQPIAAGATNNEFSGDFMPNLKSGQSIIRYVFFNRADPNDSVCFNALYQAYPLGVDLLSDQIRFSNAYPNPATARVSFNYELPSGAEASVIISNILGSVLKTIPVSNFQGKVTTDVSDLQEGVYLYSLVVNGKKQVTKKLIIQH